MLLQFLSVSSYSKIPTLEMSDTLTAFSLSFSVYLSVSLCRDAFHTVFSSFSSPAACGFDVHQACLGY